MADHPLSTWRCERGPHHQRGGEPQQDAPPEARRREHREGQTEGEEHDGQPYAPIRQAVGKGLAPAARDEGRDHRIHVAVCAKHLHARRQQHGQAANRTGRQNHMACRARMRRWITGHGQKTSETAPARKRRRIPLASRPSPERTPFPTPSSPAQPRANPASIRNRTGSPDIKPIHSSRENTPTIKTRPHPCRACGIHLHGRRRAAHGAGHGLSESR